MLRNLIYGLVDPRTLLVRYVGKSTTGLSRPRSHKRPSQLKDSGWRAHWIKSLHSLGLDYGIVVLEEAATKEALYAVEMFWVAYGRACGWPLTNLTDGGDGMHGWKASASTREKLSEAAKRRLASPEARARLGRAISAGWSDDSRARIAASNRHRGQTPESRAKTAATMRRIRSERFWSSRKEI